MDTYTAYTMAELCSRAYSSKETITQLFQKSPIIGSRAWAFSPSNFIEGAATKTACYFATSGNAVALIFRGSELPGIVDILHMAAPGPILTAYAIRDYLTQFTTNPKTDNERWVQSYFKSYDWIQDWIQDFSISYTDYPVSGSEPGTKVHVGFWQAWSEVKVAVEQVVKQLLSTASPLTEPLTFFITGHSLGAALATLAAASLIAEVLPDLPPCKVKMFAFGSPYVGNAKFAQFYDAQISKIEAASWMIRNRSELINTANSILRRTHGDDPYSDVGNGFSTMQYYHWMSKYLAAFAPTAGNSSPQGMLEAAAPSAGIVYPPDRDAPITSLVIRTMTASNGPVTNASTPFVQWQFTLLVGVDANGKGGIPLANLQSDQVLPFFIPGQIDTFFIKSLPINLSVYQLRRCALKIQRADIALEEPGSAIGPIPRAAPIVLAGLQLYVNGYDFFTDYNLSASLSEHGAPAVFEVPLPYYSIVGREGLLNNLRADGPWVDDKRSWGVTGTARASRALLDYNNSWNTLITPNAVGVLQTNIYTRSVFSPQENGYGYQVVGGYSVIADIREQNPPKPLTSWGESPQPTDRTELLTVGYGWNPYATAVGYEHSYVVLRPVSNVDDALPKLIGGAMLVTDLPSQAPLRIQSLWGEVPLTQLTHPSDFPATVVAVTSGFYWNKFLDAEGFQYTVFCFDKPIPKKPFHDVDIHITVTIDEVECIFISDSAPESHDEIYIKKDGQLAWPVNAVYKPIKAGQQLPVGLSCQLGLDESHVYDLWDYDTISNDLLFKYALSLNTPISPVDAPSQREPLGACAPGKYLVYGENEGNGGAYILHITLA